MEIEQSVESAQSTKLWVLLPSEGQQECLMEYLHFTAYNFIFLKSLIKRVKFHNLC